MSVTVTRIRSPYSTLTPANEWYVLPTPMAITGGTEVLDSSNSGRDNNTGIMYRDIVRTDVANYSCTLPAGINNVDMAKILDIINKKYFNMLIPDITKGYFTDNRKFYNASAEPEIEIVHTVGMNQQTASWEYKEYTFKAVEI